MVATRPSRHRRLSWVARLLLLAIGGFAVAGCTGETGKPDPGLPKAGLEISLIGGVDAMSPEARDELQTEIGDVLSAYVVSAFLGDYPRDDFVRSLDSFTSGAAEFAAGDLELLTASGFSEADEVRARRLVARIWAFAPDGKARGASAHVSFEFAVTDDAGADRPLALSGRLMLAPEGQGWRIFGYDVQLDTPGGA